WERSMKGRTRCRWRECPRASCGNVVRRCAAASACRETARPAEEKAAVHARHALCPKLRSSIQAKTNGRLTWSTKELRRGHYRRRVARSQPHALFCELAPAAPTLNL